MTEPDPETVERVARAIYASLDEDATYISSDFKDGSCVGLDGEFDLLKAARHAIAAMNNPSTKEREAAP